MELGKRIWTIRNSRGYSRPELAKKVPISKDYLKEIETGRKLSPSYDVLSGLAAALEVNIGLFFLSEEEFSVQLSRREFLQKSFLGGVALLPEPHKNLSTGVIEKHQNSPEFWILQGDQADIQGAWNHALDLYQNALLLLPRDYRWARYVVSKIAQMHINLGDYELAEGALSQVEQLIKEWNADRINYELTIGAIKEKRGWIYHFRGQYDLAISSFQETLKIADKWGDNGLQSVSHHFIGNAISHSTSHLLFSDVFPKGFPIARTDTKLLNYGMNELHIAQEMHKKSEPNVAFSIQSEAISQFALKDKDEALRLLRKSIDMFDTWLPAQADALVLRNRIKTITDSNSWTNQDFYDELESLEELRVTLSAQPNPLPYVGATLSLLIVKYLSNDYRKNASKRKDYIDLCLICMLLHFEPNHIYFNNARKLLMYVSDILSDREYREYLILAPSRLLGFQDSFSELQKFSTPKLAVTNAVLELFKAVHKT